jgi:hypothetical protein
MTVPTASSTVENIAARNVRTGSKNVHTRPVTILTGQVLSALTVMAISAANNKAVPHNPDSTDVGIKKALFILPHDIDTTSGDKVEPVIDGGDFNPDALIWHASADTLDERIAAFAGTDISMIKPY